MSQIRINELIETLGLKQHPEGGFYSETYRSEEEIPESVLGKPFDGNRNYATGIYFLLTSDTFSAFHKINQDEMWHFYEGSSVTIHMINMEGEYSSHKLGLDFKNGERPQFNVPKGVWFAAEVSEQNSYVLVGCNVFPGFDFKDFELAERETFSSSFPVHKELIKKFTRV